MSTSAQIFIYLGNDEVAINRQIQALQAKIGADSNAQMNITRLDAPSSSAEALNNALNAMPFLSAHRLVLIANPSKKFTSSQAKEKFLAQLSQTAPSTWVGIYEITTDRRLENHWLVKWGQKTAQAQIKILNLPKDMTSWIVKECQQQGGKIDPAAAHYLAEIVGNAPRHAAQEITKLLTYVNAERPITRQDIEAVSVSITEASIFDLVDAIGSGKARQAQALYHQLLANQDAFSIFGMIIRQFRLLLQTRELLDQSATRHEIKKALNQRSDYVVNKITQQARRFDLPTLERVYHRLLTIDLEAKTGQMPLELNIDLLIADFS